jgi:hypothetical protein
VSLSPPSPVEPKTDVQLRTLPSLLIPSSVRIVSVAAGVDRAKYGAAVLGRLFDGLRNLLLLDTDGALARQGAMSGSLDRISDAFTAALENTSAGRRHERWGSDLQDTLTRWTAAMRVGDGDPAKATAELVAA